MKTMRIGPIIRSLREQRGLTQAELAAKAGITQSYLSRAETSPRGDRIPPDILERIASALGITSDEILIQAGRTGAPHQQYVPNPEWQ